MPAATKQSKAAAAAPRSTITAPVAGDVVLFNSALLPAVVHRVEYGTVWFWHNGGLREYPLSYWQQLIAEGNATVLWQTPDVPGVTIEPEDNTAPATAGTGSFTVTMTSPGQSGSWIAEADSGSPWLTIESPSGPQFTDGVVNYSFTENTDTASRMGHFYVNGKTFTLIQDAAAPARRSKS